jgi:hypothetical protein
MPTLNMYENRILGRIDDRSVTILDTLIAQGVLKNQIEHCL